MSHITTVQMSMKELEHVQTAAEAVGFVFMQGQKEHNYYAGAKARCDHALRLPDHSAGDFEIGIVQQPDGTFKLAYDNYGTGRRLEALGGRGLAKLRQEYAVAVAMATAKRKLAPKGFGQVRRENLANGQVRLRIARR